MAVINETPKSNRVKIFFEFNEHAISITKEAENRFVFRIFLNEQVSYFEVCSTFGMAYEKFKNSIKEITSTKEKENNEPNHNGS